jgi:hypothetical protein
VTGAPDVDAELARRHQERINRCALALTSYVRLRQVLKPPGAVIGLLRGTLEALLAQAPSPMREKIAEEIASGLAAAVEEKAALMSGAGQRKADA